MAPKIINSWASRTLAGVNLDKDDIDLYTLVLDLLTRPSDSEALCDSENGNQKAQVDHTDHVNMYQTSSFIAKCLYILKIL